MAIIEAKNLTREFKVFKKNSSSFYLLKKMFSRKAETKKVVDNLNLTIEEGDFVGYLGPNGAGKSTTIKMLSGVLTPTDGEITVLGMSPTKQRKAYAQKIGVLYGQRSQLWWDLPLIESFELLKAIYKVPEDEYKKRLDRFVELLDMQEFLYRPVRVLSLGQRMKGEIVATLLHSPPILFLDEPTIGLDVLAKDRIQEFLRIINKEEKVTIILTSHNMDDIEKLCNRIILIDQGKVMFDGSTEKLKTLTGKKKILILDIPPNQIDIAAPIVPLKVEGNRLFFEVSDDSEISKLITKLSNFYEVLKVEIDEPEVEEVLKDLYISKQYQLEEVSS
ncbi:ABC transporter ATP-binding protein [Priestia koreensis]|uniref:ABC transporter ATP-binding protein n=1 Tax=Priestia koreensis TaxID=284581 RepID=UPI003D06C846